MSESPQYTSLRDYVRVIREQRIVIVLVVLAVVAVTFVATTRTDKVYEARASLDYRNENDDLSSIGTSAAITESPDMRAASAAESIATLQAAERVAKVFRPKLSAESVLAYTKVQAEARTNFVVITAEAPTPKLAASLANTYATVVRDEAIKRARADYADTARTLRQQDRRLKTSPVNVYTKQANADRIARLQTLAQFATPVVLAAPAREPKRPVSPKPIRNMVLAVLVGLTLALLIAFVRDTLDRRFKSMRDIKDELKLPLLGHVRDDMLGRSIKGNGRSALSGQELEAFRIMRTNVDFLDVDRATSTVVVTSALPEEGKSTVASALAAAYATAGRRVLLVECDLRRPTLAKRMGIADHPGLSDYLLGEAEPREILQSVSIETPRSMGVNGSNGHSPQPAVSSATLVCITAGTATPQPAELLASKRFKTFLEQVAEVYDAVVIDSTPLLSVVDTLQIVPHVGRIVICVRASKTTRDQARAANAALQHFPERPTGVVVTGVRPGDEADYGYYSYAYAYAGKG